MINLKYFLIIVCLVQFSNVFAQIDITSVANNLDEETNWYALNINNRTRQTKNSFLSIQVRKDGRLVYKARTKNILLNQGISIYNKNLLEPVQVSLNDLINLNDQDRLILEVLLVDARTANILSRNRENIVFSKKEENSDSRGNLVKEHFNMQGSINILGQHSDRAGVGSTVPRNFLRADGRTTLSFSVLPVDLSFLATSEQSGVKQNMNKATARLNIPVLKQNLKNIIDEKIEAAGSESDDPSDNEFAQFKNEMVQEQFPEYEKWDIYFKSEKGAIYLEKMKTYVAVEELEESKITTTNFRKFKVLTEKESLNDQEKKEKKELHLFVLNVIKLKKEKEGLELELGEELEEIKMGYVYYEEANSYYESLSIKDYKKQNTTLNPFKLLNKTQKFLNMFQGVAIGTTNPYFSRMTLSGLLINGAHVEINPGIFYLSAVYGQSSKETYDDSFSIPSLTLKQNTFGIKAGLGSTGGNHLHFSFINIEDVESSFTLDSEITPQSNRIVGTDAAILLYEDKLKLEGEVVGSMITRNQKAGKLGQNLNQEIPLSALFPDANSTSFFDYAFRIGADWDINAAGLQLNGELERLNPNFQSLGAPTLLSNTMRWNAGVRKSLLNNKVSIGLNARRDDNSLDPLLSSVENVTEGYGGDITLAFPGVPQVFASYQPFAQNSTIIATGEEQFTNTKITNINITYPYKFGEKINLSTSFTYVNQTLDSNIEGATTKSTVYAVNQSVNFTPIGINLAASHTPGQILGDNESKNINTLNLGVNFSKNKFNSTLGWQVMQVPNQETKTGYQLSAAYKITDAILFGINAQRNIYDDLLTINSFNEYVLQSRLQITFGGKNKQEKITPSEVEKLEVAEKTEVLISNEEEIIQEKLVETKIVEEEEKVINAPISMENDNKIQNENSNKSEEVKVAVEPAPVTTENKSKEPIVFQSSDKRKHFKIMFAIESRPNKIFISLTSLGPVTYEKSGENYIYSVGRFNSLESAEKSLSKVKSRGFPKARILEFDLGELVDDKEKEEIANKDTAQIKTSYRVIFNFLKTPERTFPELAALGEVKIEKTGPDEKRIFRCSVGNTFDLEKAKNLLIEVQKTGFATAKIAIYRNGIFHKRL